jgi:hypothetical protein
MICHQTCSENILLSELQKHDHDDDDDGVETKEKNDDDDNGTSCYFNKKQC